MDDAYAHSDAGEGESDMGGIRDEALKIENIMPAMGGGMGMGGYGGDGFGGGGLIGGLLVGALLGRGRGGLGGGDDGGGCAAGFLALSSQMNQGFTNQNSLDVMSTLGSIQAAIPLAEAQVQLALAQTAASTTAQINNATLTGVQAANTNALLLTNGFANVGDKVDALSTATAVGFGIVNTNIERTGWQIAQTVQCDGDKTRALIVANQIAELNRIAQERQDEIIELRNNNSRDRDRHGIEITMVNNQNQNQLQFQAQANVLGTLSRCLHEVSQEARATNQNLIVGNAGATTTGAQTASPVNVKA